MNDGDTSSTATATATTTATATKEEPRVDALRRQVLDDALLRVCTNVAPLRCGLLALAALLAFVMRDEVEAARLHTWIVVAIVATLIINACHLVTVRGQRPSADPDDDADINSAESRFVSDRARAAAVVAVGTSLFVVAAVAGLTTWVAATSATDVEILFALFPAVSCTVGAFVCAGRRDMYVVYAVPLAAIAGLGLWSTGNDRMEALAMLTLGYAASQFALHSAVSRSLLSSLELQFTTQELAVNLANEQVALSDACEQLGVTNGKLTHLAAHDPLTDLYNRRGTIAVLDELLHQSNDGEPVGLLFCDLDRFKAVNDLLGHRGGDQFLTVLADRITRSLDSTSFAGRIGGDEFVVVLPGHDEARSAAVANRLVGVLAQPVHAEGRAMPSSVSIGVAVAPEHGATSSDLLRNANAALYRAKGGGRNRIELFDGDMRAELALILESEQSLRRAIDSGEILPFFQPEIDATSGAVVGAELLARWLRPDGTVASANEFIKLASKAGLLERLTERVLVQARPDIRRLASFGLPDRFRFRVNLGPASTDRSWRDHPIDDLVRGIDPSLITVDVRESSVISDLPAAAATLAQFRARGGRVCLDDFAKGVSSLSLLRRLPIDEVRIDRQSIDTITAHPHDRAIVRSIIALVREIGLSVTAEGVETGAQADTLIALGCVRQQGHLYSPAIPAEQFESFLVERQAAGWMAELDGGMRWATDELS
jgi:diguanylate cyclase (GGDEF)-like protein